MIYIYLYIVACLVHNNMHVLIIFMTPKRIFFNTASLPLRTTFFLSLKEFTFQNNSAKLLYIYIYIYIEREREREREREGERENLLYITIEKNGYLVFIYTFYFNLSHLKIIHFCYRFIFLQFIFTIFNVQSILSNIIGTIIGY